MSPANLNSNCVLPVSIGSSRNANFEVDVLETHSPWALLPIIFVISIFELTKTAFSAGGGFDRFTSKNFFEFHVSVATNLDSTFILKTNFLIELSLT